MKLNLGSKPLQGHPAEPWGWQCHPSGCGRQNIDPKWIILEPWYQMKFVLLGFGLTWDLSLFFFPFPTSYLWNENAILWLYHDYIWETDHVSGFRGSQLERNFPQEELYLESHIYLLLMMCRWDLWLKSWSRMSKDFRGYWDGMNECCMWEGQEFGRPEVECNRFNTGIPQDSYVEVWPPV